MPFVRIALVVSAGLLALAACAPSEQVPLSQVGSRNAGPQLPPMTATTPLRGVELLEERHHPPERPSPARTHRLGPTPAP